MAPRTTLPPATSPPTVLNGRAMPKVCCGITLAHARTVLTRHQPRRVTARSGRRTSSRYDRALVSEALGLPDAYLVKLEQTVTKLQSVLALSPDQVAAIPPPLMRIRELEQENELLHREVEELRRQLEIKNAQLRPEFRRDTYTPLPTDDRVFDREPKRRRTADANGVYMVCMPALARYPC